MPYSIPSSTKTLTLAIAPFLFILVGVLSVCEFAMVPGVYILLCSQEEEVYSSSMYTFSSKTINHKRFKPLSVTVLSWQGHY